MKTPKRTTIIYITSSIGDEQSEEKVRGIIRENSNGLPVISVSRKPVKFGKNICIGEDSDICESTTLRQILKGLLKAKTEYAIVAKSDCLYPPEYFSFTPPPKNNIYQFNNVWLLGNKYWQKGFSDSAMMGSRKHWIKIIQDVLKGHRGWKQFDIPPVLGVTGGYSWTSENPVIMIRTNSNSRHFPTVLRNVLPKNGLPFWGMATDLKTKLGL